MSAQPVGQSFSRAWTLAAVVAVGAIAAVVVLVPRWRAATIAASTADAPAASPGEPAFDKKTTVLLPAGKLKEAAIEVGPARLEEVATEVGVSGQVSANGDRRVEIRPRVLGVVRSIVATLGRKVKAGETLVTLDSPDVGTARLNLRARQRELATARVEDGWKREVAVNVEALIPLLRKDTPARELEQTFRNKLLGTFRGDLLGSYADFEIASHEEEKQADLGRKGIVGEHPVFLSRHTREGKQARFEATLEQVRFDATQQARVAEQAVRAREAEVIDAAQRLRILGVAEDMVRVLAPNAAASGTTPGEYEDVTAYPIVAPFDGTIVARSAVPSQRVEPTDSMFTLADLTAVRVTANVPESKVGLLAMGTPTIRVTAVAYPGRTFTATVIYVGQEVDPATRTVGILAEMPNPDGVLRPGMFVRIALDAPEKARALTVPAGSVVEIEGKVGVFRPGKGAGMFTFSPVVAGPEAGGRRPIESGLREGEAVVLAGAFALKSELVLQNESEE